MKNASEIKSFLESAGFKTDDVKERCGRWIDVVSIKPISGVKVGKLNRLLPKFADFIGAECITAVYRDTQVNLEVIKDFIPISESELASSQTGLCIGLTWDDRPMIIDIRNGGLLVVGDEGTGKTILLEQCKERLQGEFDIIEAEKDKLSFYGDRSVRMDRLDRETVIMADNFERLAENSQRDLLFIAMKGPQIGLYVIASTSDPKVVAPHFEYLFKNIISFRVRTEKKSKVALIPSSANTLGVYGDGILSMNNTEYTRFHTTDYQSMNIHKKENALFAEWMEHLKQIDPNADVENLFCPDGLHYSGKPVKRDGTHYVVDRDYKEELMWEKSNKVVFISKDHNLRGDDEGVDVRDESGLDNNTGSIEPHFFKRYLILNYGLGKIDLKTGNAPELFEAAYNCLDYFHSCGVIRMNAKKMAGGDRCPKEILEESMKLDEALTRRQLDLYGGRIFVCLDGTESSPVMKFLKSVFPDLERFDTGEEYTFINYSPSARIVVVHEWHPSYAISYELYYSAVNQLSKFIKSHPGFFNM